MKMTVITLLLMLLIGCRGQNNQEIILATKECQDAGLRAVLLCAPAGNCYIQCRPPRDCDD